MNNVRSSLKPSSRAGIEEFVDTAQRAYRKDFWAQLPNYVHMQSVRETVNRSAGAICTEKVPWFSELVIRE